MELDSKEKAGNKMDGTRKAKAKQKTRLEEEEMETLIMDWGRMV